MISKKVLVPKMSSVDLTCEYLPEMGRYRIQHRIKVRSSVITIDQYYSTEKECVDYINTYTEKDAAYLRQHAEAVINHHRKSRTS